MEKKNVLSEIRMESGYVSARTRIQKSIYKGTGYALPVLGTMKSVRSLKLGEMEEYDHKLFADSTMVLCLTGNLSAVTREEALRIVDGWPAGEGHEWKEEPPAVRSRRQPDVLLHAYDDTLLDVCLSFDIPMTGTDAVTEDLLNLIIG